MRVRCVNCGLDLEVPADAVGRTVCCPDCRRTFVCRLPKAIVVDEAAGPVGAELILDEELPEPEEVFELTDEAEPVEPAAAGPAEDALAALGASAPRRTVRENPRQWYVMVAGVAAVALTWRELVGKARQGEVKPKDRIYYAPKDLTVQAREVPGLFPEADARRTTSERPGARPVGKAAGKGSVAAADALGQLGGDRAVAADALERLGEATGAGDDETKQRNPAADGERGASGRGKPVNGL